MAVLLDTRTGPIVQTDGAGDQPLRQSRMGSLVVAFGHGSYFEQASRRNIYRVHANITNPLLYTGATSGPVIWNNSQVNNVVLLAVGWALTSAALSACVLGITGAGGQVSPPTASTAAASVGNCYIGGPNPSASAVQSALMTNSGTFFIPFGSVSSAAVTVDTSQVNWVEFGGSVVAPPNSWIGIGANQVGTGAIVTIGMVWEEVPIGN